MITNDYTQLHQYTGTQIFDWSTAYTAPVSRLPAVDMGAYAAEEWEREQLGRLKREDNELLEIISVLLARGFLN